MITSTRIKEKKTGITTLVNTKKLFNILSLIDIAKFYKEFF